MSVSSAVYSPPAAAAELARTMPPATSRSPSLGRAMGTTLKTRRRPRGPVEAFGPRLRRIREARGFSQGQLGLAIGASQRMIAYYESHAEKAPARHLTALAQILRVSTNWSATAPSPPRPVGPIPVCGTGCARSRPCRPRTASRSSSSLTPSSSVRRSRSGRPEAAKKEAGTSLAARDERSGGSGQSGARARAGLNRRTATKRRRQDKASPHLRRKVAPLHEDSRLRPSGGELRRSM